MAADRSSALVYAMTFRKGEITSRLRRKWPHHVALSVDKVLGLKNGQVVHSFADAYRWRRLPIP